MRTAIEFAPSEDLVPSLPRLRFFGDYELLEEIARGGMGIVYKARQFSLNRVVAIKMMRPGLMATGEEVDRFQAEAKTVAALRHPNIVKIYEVGEQQGFHYFSMDYVDGPSLATVDKQQPLEFFEAARHVQEIAEAVHYAHGMGILHRDLKPSNILLDAAGSPHISDFGLARRFSTERGLTVTGAVMGTPGYMSPEQAAGKTAELTPATDVYSLGAILYELLTGRPPFRESTPIETMKLALESEPDHPRAIRPAVPRDLQTICLKCLEKEPGRRYASAQMLADDLARFLNNEQVQARPAGIAGKAWRWCDRNRWPAVTAAALLLLAVVSGLWLRNTWIGSKTAIQAPPAESAQTQPELPVTAVGAPAKSSVNRSTPGELAAVPATIAPPPRQPGDSTYRQIRGFALTQIAGPGNIGDGVPVSKAYVRGPTGITTDSAGNVYFTDSFCQCIRKIDRNRAISTVAGRSQNRQDSARTQPSLDGAPALNAWLGAPWGVAVDSEGSVYFSTQAWDRIRRIDRNGNLVTVAGTANRGFKGDGGPAVDADLSAPMWLTLTPDRSLYFVDSGNGRIRRVTPDGKIDSVAGAGGRGTGGTSGPALLSQISLTVIDLVSDHPGAVYFRDAAGIRRITPDGLIALIPGTARTASLATTPFRSAAGGLAIDMSGNFLAGETSDNPAIALIRKVTPEGAISTIAGDGNAGYPEEGLPAAKTRIVYPRHMAADFAGNLYVADTNTGRILQIDANGIVRTLASSDDVGDGGYATEARMNCRVAIGGPDGEIYIADVDHRIRKIDRSGRITTVVGTGRKFWDPVPEGLPAIATPIQTFGGMAIDPQGSLVFSDVDGNRVRRLLPDGSLQTVAGNGSAGFTGDGGPANQAQIRSPGGLAFDAAGNLFIADANSKLVRRVTPPGIISTVAGGFADNVSWSQPVALAFDAQGNLLIADSKENRVYRMTPAGVVAPIAGSGALADNQITGPASERPLNAPRSVAVAKTGEIFIATGDYLNWISPDGMMHSERIENGVQSVALDSHDNLIVAQGPHGVIRLTPQR